MLRKKHKTIIIETDFSDMPTDALRRLHKFIGNEFFKPYEKMKIVAVTPWRIMMPIQYELSKRKK